MPAAPATVRVVSTDPASQGPFVLVNAADFDPAVHQLYAEPATAEAPPAEPAAATETTPKRRGRSATTT